MEYNDVSRKNKEQGITGPHPQFSYTKNVPWIHRVVRLRKIFLHVHVRAEALCTITVSIKIPFEFIEILTFRWPCIVINSYNNQLDAPISQIYFWNKTLHVSDSSSVHHQEFFTVHTAMVHVIQVCRQLANRIRTEPVPSWSCDFVIYIIQ